MKQKVSSTKGANFSWALCVDWGKVESMLVGDFRTATSLCLQVLVHLGSCKARQLQSMLQCYVHRNTGSEASPRGARKAATVTRWTSGSSPVRYLRISVTLCSRAATSERFSSSRRRAMARNAALLPLSLLMRLRSISQKGHQLFLYAWSFLAFLHVCSLTCKTTLESTTKRAPMTSSLHEGRMINTTLHLLVLQHYAAEISVCNTTALSESS